MIRKRGGWQMAGLGAALLLILAACAPQKAKIRSDVDETANFASYRTFSFAPQLGTDRAGYSSLMSNRFKQAVQNEMQARGYQYVDSGGDLLVNFSTNVREQVDIESTPSASVGYGYYGYRGSMYGAWPGQDVSTVRYKVGTLNIDVVDAQKKQLVWEGVAEGELTEKVMKDPETAINTVVRRVFERFPAKAAVG